MATDDRPPQKSTTGRLRRGALAVAAGAGCMIALMVLPGGAELVEAGVALLGIALLVAGTLWVGGSADHRIA
jgi:hypothetical protein